MTARQASWARGVAVGVAAWMLQGGAALAQSGPSSGAAGGPSNGYGAVGIQPEASRGNTPTTGGGPTTQTGKGAESAKGLDVLSGRVEKLDRSGHTLRLQGVDRKLEVDSHTTVLRDGASASLDDVREGDQVRASMQSHGDQVKQLDILSGKARGESGATSTGRTR